VRIKHSSKSLSYLAKKQILQYIEKNGVKPNDQLPTEANLGEMLGVSRITVREALAQLGEEGIIYKVQGKGTFLQRVPVLMESGLEILNTPTEIMQNFGYNPHSVYLQTKVGLPEDDVREKLRLGPEDKIVTYRRKRYADGELAVYGVDMIAAKHFKDNIPQRFPGETMLGFLEDELGFTMDYAYTEIVPVLFDRETADLLEVSQDIIFLLLSEVYIDVSGQPVVYSLNHFNTNVFKFIIHRKRKDRR
jgi:GntR family transcriptional regulator